MSQRAGWYPDPAGVEGRFRYWDGTNWSSAVTFNPDGTAPVPPTEAAPTAAPGQLSRRAKIALAVVAGLVLVGLVAVLIGTVPAMLQPPKPSPTGTSSAVPPPPVASGTVPASAALNCAGGNGVTLGQRANEYASTGVTVTVPSDWGFRFSATQWTWLDDAALWGKGIGNQSEGRMMGMALGGVAARNGFRTPEQAAQEIYTCLIRYGAYNDREYPMTEESSAAVTIAGMPGWQRVLVMDERPDGPQVRLTIIVLDSGQPAKLASLVTLAPLDDAAARQIVDRVAASLRKQ